VQFTAIEQNSTCGHNCLYVWELCVIPAAVAKNSLFQEFAPFCNWWCECGASFTVSHHRGYETFLFETILLHRKANMGFVFDKTKSAKCHSVNRTT
jgi:hypothetical protein